MSLRMFIGEALANFPMVGAISQFKIFGERHAGAAAITYHERSVICERRVVDVNSRRLYERETETPLPSTQKFVIMNAWYRQRLAINVTQIRLPLEIIEENGFMASHVSVFWEHPQAVVRTNILVAVVSIGLGILGLVLGLVSLFRR